MKAIITSVVGNPTTITRQEAKRAERRQRHLVPVNPELCTKAFPSVSKMDLVQDKAGQKKTWQKVFSKDIPSVEEENAEYIRQMANTSCWEEYSTY